MPAAATTEGLDDEEGQSLSEVVERLFDALALARDFNIETARDVPGTLVGNCRR